MESMGFSLEKAMQALRISEEDRAKYAELLAKQQVSKQRKRLPVARQGDWQLFLIKEYGYAKIREK